MPRSVLSLKTPLKYFCIFFHPILFDHISEQRSLYSALKHIQKPLNICSTDVKKNLLICILSSMAVKIIRLFGKLVMKVPLGSRIMILNKFESIRQFFNLNDITLSIGEVNLVIHLKSKIISCFEIIIRGRIP